MFDMISVGDYKASFFFTRITESNRLVICSSTRNLTSTYVNQLTEGLGTCVCAHACIVYIYIYIYIYIYTHVFVFVFVCMWICLCLQKEKT